MVRAATFNPDGRFVATAGNDNAARVWQISLGAAAPGWVRELAQAVGGYQLGESGGAEPVFDPWGQLVGIRDAVMKAGETNVFVPWARWFLADRARRTISPFSSIRVDDFVGRLIAEGGQGNLRDALELQPDNALALAKLARLQLSKEPEQADFHSRLAVAYEPRNPAILWTRAAVLQATNRNEEAWPVMETALAADPFAAATFGPAGGEFSRDNVGGTASKGWLPKSWVDHNTNTTVDVTYAKLNDPPSPELTALQIVAVAKGTRAQATARGMRFIGRQAGRFTIEGWVRSARRTDVYIGARQFNEPFEKFAEQSLRTTEQWKPFKIPLAPGKDFAAELYLVVPADGSVDIAGLTVKAE
jgi:hypothetical protein